MPALPSHRSLPRFPMPLTGQHARRSKHVLLRLALYIHCPPPPLVHNLPWSLSIARHGSWHAHCWPSGARTKRKRLPMAMGEPSHITRARDTKKPRTNHVARGFQLHISRLTSIFCWFITLAVAQVTHARESQVKPTGFPCYSAHLTITFLPLMMFTPFSAFCRRTPWRL